MHIKPWRDSILYSKARMFAIKALLWDLLALWPLVFSFSFLFSKLVLIAWNYQDTVIHLFTKYKWAVHYARHYSLSPNSAVSGRYSGPPVLGMTMQGAWLQKSLANSRHSINSSLSPLLWATACRHFQTKTMVISFSEWCKSYYTWISIKMKL